MRDIGGSGVMQGEHFEQKRNRDAERRPEDHDLIHREVENADNLQDLNDVVGDSRRCCRHACSESNGARS